MRTFSILFFLTCLLAPVYSSHALETPSVGKDKSLLDLYQEGGPAMHLIALTSVGTIAIIVFCAMQIGRKKMVPPTLVTTFNQQMANRDLQSAMSLCDQTNSVLGATLKAALLKANFRREHYNKPAMEQAAADAAMQEETRYMQWINMLNACATIAPMIGLLATVSGMIASFGTLASGKSEASDLAGGIGEAMVGTASGLLIAIPAMFFFFYFRNSLQSLITEVQRTVNLMIDLFTGDLLLYRGQIVPAHNFDADEPVDQEIEPVG